MSSISNAIWTETQEALENYDEKIKGQSSKPKIPGDRD